MGAVACVPTFVGTRRSIGGRMDRRAAIDEWISTIARVLGLVGLVAFSAKWMATGKIEPTLVAAAGGLYGLGKAGEALAALRRTPVPAPPPIPDTTTGAPRSSGESDGKA